MVDVKPGALVHKRCITVVDDLVEQQVGVRYEHDVLVARNFFYLHGQVGHDTQCVDMLKYQVSCIVVDNFNLNQLQNFIQL